MNYWQYSIIQTYNYKPYTDNAIYILGEFRLYYHIAPHGVIIHANKTTIEE